jgi:D-amino-acid oxidase
MRTPLTQATSQPKIAIVGAGIMGLTCAAELNWAGYKKITVFGEKVTPNTTSDVAAALWEPYKAYPEHLVNKWCNDSLLTLNKLLDVKEAGVSWITYREIFQKNTPLPNWMHLVERQAIDNKKLPQGYVDGYTVRVPLIHSALHLSYLMRMLENENIPVKQEKISAIQNLIKQFDVVVNCTGLGARELVGDASVFPIRGQVVVFTKPQNLNFSIADFSENLTYVITRTEDCIVGGTAERNNWNLEPDDETTRLIVERAYGICPELKAAKILGVKVGLRPGRDAVRLEAEKLNGSLIVHNYGHGGAGYTLAWGCAAEVRNLVNKHVIA